MSDRLQQAYDSAETDRRLGNLVQVGVVESVENSHAKVRLDDDLVTTGLPWIERRSGSVRTGTTPTVGEQVVVLAPSGELGAGMILGGLASDERPALTASVDEERTDWDDGASDVYDAAAHVRTITVPTGGKVVIKLADGPTLTLQDGELTVEADTITLKADSLQLGPDGDRKKVAREGDPIVAGKIANCASAVKAG